MSNVKVNQDGTIQVSPSSKMAVTTLTSVAEPVQTTAEEQSNSEITQPDVVPNTVAPIPENSREENLRLLADWGFLACAGLFSVILFGGGLYELFIAHVPWLVDVLRTQFAALIIPPMTMVSAMLVVTALKVMSGPMKFKILGFEFEGSSAPIIMWILVYLVMIHSVTLLWVDPAITQNITTLVK